MVLIDSHAHLNFKAFGEDRDKVINKCLENDVWVINIGTNYETSKLAVEIAEKYEKGLWAAIGLHPMGLDTGLLKLKSDDLEGGSPEKEFEAEKYRQLAKSKKVVAIGEVGLDYYWRPKGAKKRELFKEKQAALLRQELNLAVEFRLPVVFHCRMAHNDLINILKKQQKENPLQGVVHSFVGTLEQAREYLEMGFYLGFNGMIFKKIEDISFEKIIKEVPLDRILIETDSPYLIPPQAEAEVETNDGLKRNNPLFVKYVAQRIAEIKGKLFEEVAEVTASSAQKLFSLKI